MGKSSDFSYPYCQNHFVQATTGLQKLFRIKRIYQKYTLEVQLYALKLKMALLQTDN